MSERFPCQVELSRVGRTMAQQLRSSSLGPQQRRTQPNCVRTLYTAAEAVSAVQRRAPSRPNVVARQPHETQAFQTSKLLSIRVAPQTATPFVSSSSPAQIARPLSQPLRSTSNGKPTSPSPSPWAEARRRLLWFFGTRALAIAGIGELQLQHGRVGSTGGLGTHVHAVVPGGGTDNPGRHTKKGILDDTNSRSVRRIQGVHTVCKLSFGASDITVPARPFTDSRPPLSCRCPSGFCNPTA